jgi:hypothetical protein
MIADPLTLFLAVLSAFGCGVFAYPTVSRMWATWKQRQVNKRITEQALEFAERRAARARKAIS